MINYHPGDENKWIPFNKMNSSCFWARFSLYSAFKLIQKTKEGVGKRSIILIVHKDFPQEATILTITLGKKMVLTKLFPLKQYRTSEEGK